MKESLGARPLALPTPVWVVGAYDLEGKPNAMTVSWAGLCCTKPPCLYISLRQATYSYAAVMQRKAYTINIPSEEQAPIVDYLGMASGRDEDKLAAAGLTPIRSDLVDAPYIREFPMILECRVIHTLNLGLHTQFIGEIKDVKCDSKVLNQAGNPNIALLKPFVHDPKSRTYHGLDQSLGSSFSLGRKYMSDPRGPG
jgi:flavin reductase (DIM6/NTAB) family NADH-FMN oxidoreductase RutF